MTHTRQSGLCGDDPLATVRGVFLANHMASTDNLTRTTKRQNTYNIYQRKLTTYKRALISKQQHIKNTLRYKTEQSLVWSPFMTSGQETQRNTAAPREPYHNLYSFPLWTEHSTCTNESTTEA